MHHNRSILLVLIILALSCCIQGAFAGAPPYSERADWVIADNFTPFIIPSEGNCTVTSIYPPVSQEIGILKIPPDMSDSAPNISTSPPPYFPDLSQDYALRNITCEKPSDRFISIVWYFNKWDTFQVQRERLFSYLIQHGSISNVTLTLVEKRSSPDNPGNFSLQNVSIRYVTAFRYSGTNTSGYFVIFDSGFLPRPNYFIAYYGVVGSSDVDTYLPNLESFLSLRNSDDEFNPVVPMATPTIPLPIAIPFGAVAIVIMIRKNRGNT